MDSCIYDVCSNTEDNKAMKELSCSSMTAMARECESLKVPIDDWMTLHGCCVYFNNDKINYKNHNNNKNFKL